MTIPDAVHELVEYEVACAYANGKADGYHQALVDVAERADALDQTWRPATWRTHEQVVADRAASLPPTEGVDAWLDRYAAWSRRHADEAILIGMQYPPERCNLCRPRPDEVCRCNGISTPRWPSIARANA